MHYYSARYFGALLALAPLALWYFRVGKAICALAIAGMVCTFCFMMGTGHQARAIIPLVIAIYCVVPLFLSDKVWPWSRPQEEPIRTDVVQNHASQDKILEEISEQDEVRAQEVLTQYMDKESKKDFPNVSSGERFRLLSEIGRRKDS